MLAVFGGGGSPVALLESLERDPEVEAGFITTNWAKFRSLDPNNIV